MSHILPVEIKVEAKETIGDSNEYVCYHSIRLRFLAKGKKKVPSCVHYVMPGQGFKPSEQTRSSPPFEMKFGPCWGRPHVTIDVEFRDGTIAKAVFSENLPAKSATFRKEIDLSKISTSSNPKMGPPATVELSSLRAGDKKPVETATRSLKYHGFCFLTIGIKDRDVLTDAPRLISKYLSSNEAPKKKGDIDADDLTGHITTRFKNTIRVLSGDYLRDEIDKVPSKLRDDVRELAEELDDAQRDIVNVLAKPLLNCDASKVGEKFDIPLLQNATQRASPIGSKTWRSSWKKKSDADRRFGLVDCVLYKMSKLNVSKEAMVASHVDPGLFVLSLPQSSPGLELKTADGRWISPPPNRGVLWTGSAAVAAGCAGGQHRVVNMRTDTRFAVWHELCTSKQITPPMLRRIKSEGIELHLGPIHGTKNVLRALSNAENHEDEDEEEDEEEKEKDDIVPNLALVMAGMPMSKSGAHDFDYRNVEPITDTTAGYGRKQMFRAFEPVAKTVEVSKRRERSRATEEKKKRAPLLGRRIPIPRGRPLSKVALPMRPWSPPKNSRRTPTIDDEDMWRRD